MPSIEIKDKVVLITGTNRGIGKALVEVCLEQGASKVYAGVRSLDKAACFADNSKVVPLVMDLSDLTTLLAAAKESEDVDVVINNGGRLSQTTPLQEDAISNLQAELDVNCFGLMRMAQVYLPILESKISTTAFVQINSVASFRCGIDAVATYSASKAAAYSITQALLKSHGDRVRILSVHPGPIATDMIANASTDLAAQAEPPEQVAHEILKALATPDQVHVFPDSKAKNLAKLLTDYTKIVVEEGNSYGV